MLNYLKPGVPLTCVIPIVHLIEITLFFIASFQCKTMKSLAMVYGERGLAPDLETTKQLNQSEGNDKLDRWKARWLVSKALDKWATTS